MHYLFIPLNETTRMELKCRLQGLIQGNEQKYMIKHVGTVAISGA